MLSAKGWTDIPGLLHGFLSRSQRAREAAAVDWHAEIADEGMAGVPVVVARQVHGTRVERVRGPEARCPEADGLLTATPGFAVGVVTADCVPILLVAEEARVAAAVHSGWRGTLAGIVAEATAAVASEAGVEPGALRAAIGPAIGGCCYEVGPEVRVAFERRWGTDFVAPMFKMPTMPSIPSIPSRPGIPSIPGMPGPRPRLDLRSLVRRQLEIAGVPPDAIEILGPCTKCASEYASVRRDGPAAGRQLSFVGWQCSNQ